MKVHRLWLSGFFGGLLLTALAGSVILLVPGWRERLIWHAGNWEAQIRRWLNPPEQVLFLPVEQEMPTGTLPFTSIPAPNATLTSFPRGPATSPATSSPQPPPPATITPTFTLTPLPGAARLSGIRHEYQQFNNCGPANLAMALSFWGWSGSQNETRDYLRPNRAIDDKNVNPDEMVAFVASRTELNALYRVGGDRDTLRRFLAAGFPVIIEKGHDPADDWWMGHYVVVSGYDDTDQSFIVQDSLSGPDLRWPYEHMGEWRDFNYVYIVIYPPERLAEIQALLGPQLDSRYNYETAMLRAQLEIPTLHGRELFFAWFNLGSSQTGLELYTQAAAAYDQAFQLYARLPEDERPYRLMWYQSGPYRAYYFTGRYQDVINLANTTLTWVGRPVLEETYYWRGLAYAALGQLQQAIADWKKAAALNPNYLAPRQALEQYGVAAP